MNLPADAALRRDLEAAIEAVGGTPSPAAIEILVKHLALLAKWNGRYHLTTITDWPEILDRHVRESLLPLEWIGESGRLLDIGTGNGFPAIPVLALRAGLAGVLVERSQRKCLFLDAVVTGARLANARVVNGEIERLDAEALGGPFDYVVSRATLAAGEYLEVAARHCARGGIAFLYAGGGPRSAHPAGQSGDWETAGEKRIPGRESRVIVYRRLP